MSEGSISGIIIIFAYLTALVATILNWIVGAIAFISISIWLSVFFYLSYKAFKETIDSDLLG